MATTNIDEIFKQIEKDFVEISKEAARTAANKAQRDIRKKADQFIDEYYAYKPKIYKNRKKALYSLVTKVYDERVSSDGITIEFGVMYDASRMNGVHTSNSWYHQSGGKWISRATSKFQHDRTDNGIPSAEWITNKFLSGIHPSGLLGDNGGHKDKKSPDKKMQEFFDKELDEKIGEYMYSALLDGIKKYF